MKVSVILPTRNRSYIISKAIESVLGQSVADWELIIIDDDSSDDTELIISQYIKQDSRIVYLKMNKKNNLQSLINFGLQAAKGQYIARIDDDDVWINKDKLKKQINYLDNNPECKLIGSWAVVINQEDKELFYYDLPSTDQEIRKHILLRNFFINSSVVFETEGARLVNGFDEQLSLSGDYDMWLKLGKLGKLYIWPEYLTALRYDDNNLRKKRIIRTNDSLQIIRKYRDAYPGFYVSLLANYLKLIYLFVMRIGVIDKFLYRLRVQRNFKL